MDDDVSRVYLRVLIGTPFNLQFYCNGH